MAERHYPSHKLGQAYVSDNWGVERDISLEDLIRERSADKLTVDLLAAILKQIMQERNAALLRYLPPDPVPLPDEHPVADGLLAVFTGDPFRGVTLRDAFDRRKISLTHRCRRILRLFMEVNPRYRLLSDVTQDRLLHLDGCGPASAKEIGYWISCEIFNRSPSDAT